VDASAGLVLDGVMGYEGHCVMEADADRRRTAAGAAIDRLIEVADHVRAAGHRIDIVSAGGTGTTPFTGADPRVTDIQAGSYVFMDTAYERVLGDFAPALTVLATVVSRHAGTAVLDCGIKTIASSLGTPRLAAGGGSVRYVAEEHTVVDLEAGATLDVGDRVQVVSGHCCETVNLHDRLFLHEDGVILDIWPMMGRGPGGAWQ
jgi:D-serine deaminase-like pyridoxal phosphate-dependent protein